MTQMINNLTLYKGICIYFQDNLFKCECNNHLLVDAELERIKQKIDDCFDTSTNTISDDESTSNDLYEDIETDDDVLDNTDDSENKWVATIHLNDSNIDDSFEDNSTVTVTVEADNFNYALKYTQQYIKNKQLDDKTNTWDNAEILALQHK